MNRYTKIAELMDIGLKAKTGWGRNEVKELLGKVLIQVADEEISAGKHNSKQEMNDDAVEREEEYNPRLAPWLL